MIIVTGGNGQLGNCLKEFLPNAIYLGSHELDITDKSALSDFFKENRPSHVINCAAFTHVDKCESEEARAFAINRDGPRNLALECSLHKSKLIHISTDYVFDGHTNTTYKEDSPVNPISVYGKSKLAGELEIQNSNCQYVIIRTSWLYSEFNANFVKNILNLMKSRDSLGIVFDQVGSPTYAMDLAQSISEIILQSKSINNQIYHFSNLGVTSWYDLTKEIQHFFKIKCNISPIETFQYPTPAKRPHYSVFNTTKIRNNFNLEIPYWKESLYKCLKKLS